MREGSRAGRAVRRAHQALTARLEAVEAAAESAARPAAGADGTAHRSNPGGADTDLDVPEFLPPR